MSDKHYEFEVKMACGGCSGAVERVLKKLDGISLFLLPPSSFLLPLLLSSWLAH
ncbi:hypothetical protein FN846DRAFT_928815 [Sphaerosporella brunnea]|uniref:HMA domain-containing protein n=1 Tax=Sphaerosporella brunnea TaxID=1250544 RepID=A0A5J5F9F5_9PEZI|nr:hypothetical protein FN846DRAFT_928815 [Sphaerosporella brunnea]